VPACVEVDDLAGHFLPGQEAELLGHVEFLSDAVSYQGDSPYQKRHNQNAGQYQNKSWNIFTHV